MNGDIHENHSDSDSSVTDSESDGDVSTNRTESTSVSTNGHSTKDIAHKNNIHFKENTYSKRKSRLQRKDTNHYYR